MYEGQKKLTARVGQLASDGVVPRSQEKQIEKDWIEFFSTRPTRISELTLWSRVKQELVDAVAGQPQLTKLTLKWGPYWNLEPIGTGGWDANGSIMIIGKRASSGDALSRPPQALPLVKNVEKSAWDQHFLRVPMSVATA